MTVMIRKEEKMQKKISSLLLILALLLLAACGGAPEVSPPPTEPAEAVESGFTPLTFTDALGREVTLTEKPKKAAALIGSFASVWTLAGGELCAAADDAFDDFGLTLGEDVVNLGKTKEIQTELLFSAEPDLILASVNTPIDVELRDTFEKAGIPTLYFDVNDFASYLDMLRVCTAITGRDDLYEKNGQMVSEQIDAAVEKAKAALNGEEGPTVLYLRATASSVKAKSSRGTVLGEMLQDLGCVNIADGSALLESLSIEEIILRDPEYIFIVEQGNDTQAVEDNLRKLLLDNPAWSSLSAMQNEKVYYLDGSLYNLKPNDRWGIAYEQLEELLYE